MSNELKTYSLGLRLLKTWVPVVVGIFTLAGFWFALNARVATLEAKAEEFESDKKAQAEIYRAFLDQFNKITVNIEVMKNDIQYIKKALDNTVYGRFQNGQ